MTTYTATGTQQLRELVGSIDFANAEAEELMVLYRRQYTNGWRLASQGTECPATVSGAYAHGYEDQACGLPKWTALAETGILG